MYESIAAPNALSLTGHDMDVITHTLSQLLKAQTQIEQIRSNLRTMATMVADHVSCKELVFMLKNKWGLSKKEAKKLFYQYHGSDEADEDMNDNQDKDPQPPETVDQKIAMIMDYMKETTAKLDSIDRDIDHLKKQVEEILKRI